MLTSADPFPQSAAAELTLDRRRFLCGAAAAAALVAGGEWAAGRSGVEDATPSRVTLPAADPLTIGEARAVTTPDGRAVLAVRLDADTVVAFDRRCPHLGCPVVWEAAQQQFACPCHRAAFDARTGNVLSGPPRRGLVPIAVEGA